MDPLKLLITSVGSFLGHNILDSLEAERPDLRVIGANYDADNPRLFRCDRVFLVPRIEETEEFDRRLEEIIAIENPDMIFPGRDHDVIALARLREGRPELASKIPCGPIWLADLMQDKLKSAQFAIEHQVPFAETMVANAPANRLRKFVGRHGFPLIAKPVRGFGSLGARVILNSEHLASVASLDNYIVQPFMAPPEDLHAQIPDFSAGIPLFFGFTDDHQFAAQTVINPKGECAEPCCTINRQVIGRAERSELWPDPRFKSVALKWAQAVSNAGWRGSFNLQCRRLGDGSYVGFELNGRMSGSTSARCLLGFHEPRKLVEQFLGAGRWPDRNSVNVVPGFVSRSLSDGFVATGDVSQLRARGVWPAS